jgi:hypothetical protein
MKQKNLSELRETLIANNSTTHKEKTITLNFDKKALLLKYDNTSNKNEESIKAKKKFNLSSKLNGNNINSFNLSKKKAKPKTNMKLLLQQQNSYNNNISNSNDKKNNLIMSEKNENKIKNNFIGNNNLFNNKQIELSLRSKININDIKLFSFSDNNKNNINNIFPIRKSSDEKKQKILLNSGNKSTNYRKYLFNEKMDSFNIKNIKD